MIWDSVIPLNISIRKNLINNKVIKRKVYQPFFFPDAKTAIIASYKRQIKNSTKKKLIRTSMMYDTYIIVEGNAMAIMSTLYRKRWRQV